MKNIRKFNNLTEYKAPAEYPLNIASVFLAGSIEMGTAIDWQTELISKISDKDMIVLNPRRDNWDSSWEQRMSNPHFNEQVTWELDALDACSMIVMYFDPNTKSPISLIELGLYAESEKLYVCCPDGFWRKGNVEIVCDRYGIEMFDSLEDIADFINDNF